MKWVRTYSRQTIVKYRLRVATLAGMVCGLTLVSCQTVSPVRQQCGVFAERVLSAGCINTVVAEASAPKGSGDELEYVVRKMARAIDAKLDRSLLPVDFCRAADSVLATSSSEQGRALLARLVRPFKEHYAERLAQSQLSCKWELVCDQTQPDSCVQNALRPCLQRLWQIEKNAVSGKGSVASVDQLHAMRTRAQCAAPFLYQRERTQAAADLLALEKSLCQRSHQLLEHALLGGSSTALEMLTKSRSLAAFCTSREEPSIHDAQRKAFLNMLEASLYIEGGIDVATMTRWLDLYDVKYTKADTKRLYHRLVARGSLSRLQEDALQMAMRSEGPFSAGEKCALAGACCRWAMRAEDAIMKVSGDSVSTLAINCPTAYATWATSMCNKHVASKRYDEFERLSLSHIKPAHLEKTGWFRKLEKKVQKNLARSRKLLGRLASRCNGRNARTIKSLVEIEDYGLLAERRESAVSHCLAAYDSKLRKQVESSLYHSCDRGRKVLLRSVQASRGQASSIALSSVLDMIESSEEQIARALAGAVNGPVTPGLQDAAIAAFRCSSAEKLLELARVDLAVANPVAALSRLKKSENRRILPETEKLTKDALASLQERLPDLATDAYMRGLPGLALLYVVVFKRVFTDSGAIAADFMGPVSRRLSSLVRVRRIYESARVRMTGNMAAQMAPGLKEVYRAEVGGRRQEGVQVRFVPAVADIGWTASSRKHSMAHKYRSTGSVPNPAKAEACKAIPDAQAELASAKAKNAAAGWACKQGAGAVARRTHFLVGLLVNAGCNLASEQLLVSEAQSKHDKLVSDCQHLPAMVTITVDKEYAYVQTEFQWRYSVHLKTSVVDARGQGICTLEESASKQAGERTHAANQAVGLKGDPLVEPNHTHTVRQMVQSVCQRMSIAANQCVQQNLAQFTTGSVMAARINGTSRERELEAYVRTAAARLGRTPNYAELQDVARGLMPVEWIRSLYSSQRLR